MKKIFKILLGLILISNVYSVSAKNIINVGSCFDYPPLTYINNTGKYSGSDIQIIEDFAKDNNITIHFVKTSWPKLEDDLKSEKFDIAVGGISNSLNRQKLFLLSEPITNTQKVPLIRCEDINRFRTLDSIDQPSTRVIENEGGTNQKFAISILKVAPITIVKNNKMPFDYLINKQADVMFTDSIEAIYKHSIEPKLCVAKIDKDFPVSYKVFLFTNNDLGTKLHQQFNSWWKNKLNNK